jgi:hypothetical protein
MVLYLLASFTCMVGLHATPLAEVLFANGTSHSIFAAVDGRVICEFLTVVIFLVFVNFTLLDRNHSSARAFCHILVILDVIFKCDLGKLFYFFSRHVFSDFFLVDLTFAF